MKTMVGGSETKLPVKNLLEILLAWMDFSFDGLWTTSVPIEEAENNNAAWSSNTYPGKGEHSGRQYTWNQYVDWTDLISDEVR